MTLTPLSIEGAWIFRPTQHRDDRGAAMEIFQGLPFAEAVGHSLTVRQSNLSVSGAGVLRGIHTAQVPPGQAKYVTCAYGAVYDVVLDMRVGSPTFGQWESVVLDDIDRAALYLSEGLGHGFMSLQEGAVVTYLCSQPYAPDREVAVNPLDPALGIPWPAADRAGREMSPLVSPRHAQAPTLAEARDQGQLPRYDAVLAYRRSN